MEESQTLDQAEIVTEKRLRRRKLLPWWIKTFIWIFLVVGGFAAIAIVIGLFGYGFTASLYGIETDSPTSLTGMLVSALFIYKGVVAYMLWTEQDKAILLGKIDALVGIALCIIVMFVVPAMDNKPGLDLNLRLELIFLVPYFFKLDAIGNQWKEIGG